MLCLDVIAGNMASHGSQFFSEQARFAGVSQRSGDRRYEEDFRGNSDGQGGDFQPSSYSRSDLSLSQMSYDGRAFSGSANDTSLTGGLAGGLHANFDTSGSYMGTQQLSSSVYGDGRIISPNYLGMNQLNDYRNNGLQVQSGQFLGAGDVSVSQLNVSESAYDQWGSNQNLANVMNAARTVLSECEYQGVVGTGSSSSFSQEQDFSGNGFDRRQASNRLHSRSPGLDDKYGSDSKHTSKSHSYGNFDDRNSRDDRLSRDDHSLREGRYSDRSRDDGRTDRRSGRRNDNSQTSDLGYHADDRSHGKRSSASRDGEPRHFRDDSGFRDNADSSEHHRRRRSRSRDRDRRHRETESSSSSRRSRHGDRDRLRRDRDGDKSRERDRDRDRNVKDRDDSMKDVPWVPPPLPQHLRQVSSQGTVPRVPPPHQPGSSSASIPWVPPPIRSKSKAAVPEPPQPQNQFQNDGSFMERFRQQMQAAKSIQQLHTEDSNTSDAGSVACSETPVPEVAATATSAASVASIAPALPLSGAPVIAKRRISKILKTGMVQKRKKEDATAGLETEGGDAWSRYMNEVQKYRANKCIEDESSRPLMK